MKMMCFALLAMLLTCSCASSQMPASAALEADPAARERAIEEISQLAATHCEEGLHGPLAEHASDQRLLIRGTAGETMEGRAALEEMNANYNSRNVVVQHLCEQVHRMVYASAAGNVVWVEESIRTRAAWPPSFSVEFPSQRTMVFEREGERWALRYYALSVALSDAALDEAFAETDSPTPPPADAPAAAPAEGE